MISRLRLALLLPAAALLGCTVPTTPAPSSSNLTGNWEIQNLDSFPPGAALLNGALQVEGTQVTGIFTNVGVPCSPGIDNFAATISSSGNLALSAPFVQLQLLIPADFTGTASGTLTGGGDLCQVLMSGPVAAVEIASLTGTYTGTLTDTSSPSMSGAATLVLTQSATPNTSGQFPLSGTITFPADSGFGTAQLGGTVSGEGISLSDSSAAPNSPTVNVTASTSPDASQITVSNLLYSNFGPGAVFIYTGTLTRQ